MARFLKDDSARRGSFSLFLEKKNKKKKGLVSYGTLFRWNKRNTEQAEQRRKNNEITKQNRSELAPELDRRCDL